MADENNQAEQSIFMDLGEDNGVIATHSAQTSFPRRVATSHKGENTHNTLKPYLIAVGCVNVPDSHFAFDSSFVAPDARAGFIKLARLFDGLTEKTVFDPTPPLSVFGHADPVGKPPYNSILSARRARAIYAVLIRDVETWDDLSQHPHPMGGDQWGTSSIETMITQVGFPEGTPDAVQKQKPKDAAISIKANPQLRKKLFRKYMDFLCVRVVDGVESQFILDKQQHFLARGKGENGKGDLQGCGEFNPTLILSAKKDSEAEKSKAAREERNKENAKNRRVLIFLFKPGSKVDPQKWPCPHVKRGSNATEDCKKRFWPDFEDRLRQEADQDKEFRKEVEKKRQDTFGGTYACRFYQGIAQDSPCEGIHKQWVVRVLTETPKHGVELKPLASKRFIAMMADAKEAPRIHGSTDAQGILRLPVFDDQTEITLKLDAAEVLQPKEGADKPDTTLQPPTPEEEKSFLSYKLNAGELRDVHTGSLPRAEDGDDQKKKLAVKQRLHNLGYGLDHPEDWTDEFFRTAVGQFQKNEELPQQNGEVDRDTEDRLVLEHEPAPNPAQE